MQIKATSCEWEQSSTPIELAGQLMSLLSVPEQRSSSNHVRMVDDAWKKLYIGGNPITPALIEITCACSDTMQEVELKKTIYSVGNDS